MWRNTMVPGPGTHLARAISIWWSKGAVGEAETSKTAKKNLSSRSPEEANAWISQSASLCFSAKIRLVDLID